MLRLAQQRYPGNRGADSGDHPGGEEREGHPANRENVLTSVTGTDSTKRNGDERTGK
jgi:hypothetical protein